MTEQPTKKTCENPKKSASSPHHHTGVAWRFVLNVFLSLVFLSITCYGIFVTQTLAGDRYVLSVTLTLVVLFWLWINFYVKELWRNKNNKY